MKAYKETIEALTKATTENEIIAAFNKADLAFQDEKISAKDLDTLRRLAQNMLNILNR